MPKLVLITTAILVHVPDDVDEGFTFVEPFYEKLSGAIRREFEGSPLVEYPGVTDCEWVDLPGVNLGKCCECHRWVTEYMKPDDLKGIAGGRTVEGRLICDECEFFGDSAPAGEAADDA